MHMLALSPSPSITAHTIDIYLAILPTPTFIASPTCLLSDLFQPPYVYCHPIPFRTGEYVKVATLYQQYIANSTVLMSKPVSISIYIYKRVTLQQALIYKGPSAKNLQFNDILN